MQKTRYFIISLTIIPLYLLQIWVLYFFDLLPMLEVTVYVIRVLGILIPVVVGGLSASHSKFDYGISAIMTLSCVLTMTLAGLLSTDIVCESTPQFSFDNVIEQFTQPYTWTWCLICGAITLIASFKPIRILNVIKRRKKCIQNFA